MRLWKSRLTMSLNRDVNAQSENRILSDWRFPFHCHLSATSHLRRICGIVRDACDGRKHMNDVGRNLHVHCQSQRNVARRDLAWEVVHPEWNGVEMPDWGGMLDRVLLRCRLNCGTVLHLKTHAWMGL